MLPGYSLHSYLTNAVHVDIWWYIGSRLDAAPASLPCLAAPLEGSSIVPYRYHFNTGRFILSFPHSQTTVANPQSETIVVSWWLTWISDYIVHMRLLDLGGLGVTAGLDGAPGHQHRAGVDRCREDLHRGVSGNRPDQGRDRGLPQRPGLSRLEPVRQHPRKLGSALVLRLGGQPVRHAAEDHPAHG